MKRSLLFFALICASIILVSCNTGGPVPLEDRTAVSIGGDSDIKIGDVGDEIVDDVVAGEIGLVVDWYSSPIQVDAKEYLTESGHYDTAFSQVKKNYINDKYEKGEAPDYVLTSALKEWLTIYELGTATKGKYKGEKVMGAKIDDCKIYITMCFGRARLVRFVDTDSGPVILSNFSGELTDMQGAAEALDFEVDSSINKINIYLPASIKIPGSDDNLIMSLKDSSEESVVFLSNLKNLEFAFTNKATGLDFFKNTGNCYLARNLDGTYATYGYDLEYMDYSNAEGSKYATTKTDIAGIPDITWNDGTRNDSYYVHVFTGGCGIGGMSVCNSIVDMEPSEVEQLEVVGETSEGDSVYAYKYTPGEDPNKRMDDAYKMFYRDPKPTFDEFVKAHPVVYIRDPFDDFIEFRKEGYEPAAECGKPVIYLYPEEEMDITVEVEPNGGFTKTEPEYNDGWNVRSTTDSEILNYGDEKTYEYLFWEGIALNYDMPEEGFVFSLRELKDSLEEKLALLGLNEKETMDFMEFWYAEMTEEPAPYYFVTFVSQQVFDSLVPLTVTPKPDSIIRVFMDYKPLAEKINVEPLEIVTPVRNGFTVVEWGGELRK